MGEKEVFLKEMGARIRKLRIDHGWTQDELAGLCGYQSASKNTTIQKIEAGKSDIPASKVFKISEVLEVTPTFLLTGKKPGKK